MRSPGTTGTVEAIDSLDPLVSLDGFDTLDRFVTARSDRRAPVSLFVVIDVPDVPDVPPMPQEGADAGGDPELPDGVVAAVTPSLARQAAVQWLASTLPEITPQGVRAAVIGPTLVDLNCWG